MSSQEHNSSSQKEQYTSAQRSLSSSQANDAVRNLIESTPIVANTAEVRKLAEEAKLNASLPTPVPVNVLPNEGDAQINLMSREEYFKGLRLSGVSWDDTESFPSTFDVVTFYINGLEVSPAFRFAYPVSPADIPAEFLLPSRILGMGERFVRYKVENDAIQNPLFSDGATFTVDLIDPTLGITPSAIVHPVFPEGYVDEAYLVANGGVKVTIPSYNDEQGKDTFKLKFGTVGDFFITGEVTGTPQEVLIPDSMFRALGDGNQAITYWLYDRAGNESKSALTVLLPVLLSPQPGTLLPPLVPAANPVIELADARAGVDINIPDYPNAQRNDRIDIYASEPAGVNPVLLKTIYYPTLTSSLSYAELAAPGDVYSTQINYTVTRGTTQPKRSPYTPVLVDLSTAGPVNPEKPNPVNPLLEKPRVFGAVSATLDTLTPADRNQPADARLNLYRPLVAGEVIRLYYGGLADHVAEYVVTAADQSDQEKTLVIPWSIIAQVGNGTIPVFYRIFKNSTAANYQQSPPAQVVVSVSIVEGLTAPAFTGAAATATIINCAIKPWEGLNVRITDAVNLEVNDTVELHWVMHDDYSPNGAEVPSTRGTFTKQVPAGAQFIDFPIPYYPNMDFTKRVGHLAMYWRITKAVGGAAGTSVTVRKNYSLRNGGGYCWPL